MDELRGRRSPLRSLSAAAIIVLVVCYIAGMLSGAIGKEDRIDAAALALIGLGGLGIVGLLWPEALLRFRLFELGGFKLEMLESVKERQDAQADQLEDIALILPVLLPETERQHLLNISDGKTQGYRGGHVARTELRRLRSIGLIKMVSSRNISEMHSDTAFDLGEYVTLTDLGLHWVARIRQIEELDHG